MTCRSLITDYADSLREPAFWIYATWLELVTKYRRSRLGIVWAFIPPLLYGFGVGWFFSILQGVPPLEFIPHLSIGYVVFRLITSSLSDATATFSGHASYILDGRTRMTDYVLRVAAKSIFYFATGLPIVVVALALSPTFEWTGLLTIVPALLVVLLNMGWMCMLVAVLGARFPDVQELTGSFLMFSFLFTPIIWTSANVPADSLRGTIARVNPLFHFVELVRAPLLGEPMERLTFVYLASFLVLGWTVTVLVYRRYVRFVPIWL